MQEVAANITASVSSAPIGGHRHAPAAVSADELSLAPGAPGLVYAAPATGLVGSMGHLGSAASRGHLGGVESTVVLLRLWLATCVGVTFLAASILGYVNWIGMRHPRVSPFRVFPQRLPLRLGCGTRTGACLAHMQCGNLPQGYGAGLLGSAAGAQLDR